MTTSGERRAAGREGFALATTLLIILVLGVIAIGAAWLASGERKTSYAEAVHSRAVFAADSGTEAAINFLRLTDDPPPITDFSDFTVREVGETQVDEGQRYQYDCRWDRKRPRPGWGVEYLDYDYTVLSTGGAGPEGRTAVQIVASRLFREGY